MSVTPPGNSRSASGPAAARRAGIVQPSRPTLGSNARMAASRSGLRSGGSNMVRSP